MKAVGEKVKENNRCQRSTEEGKSIMDRGNCECKGPGVRKEENGRKQSLKSKQQPDHGTVRNQGP